MINRLGTALLRSLDPELGHGLALKALRSGLVPLPQPFSDDCLKTSIAGLDLPNPLGLAAGFDKNAEAIAPLSKAGFGFLELGAVTPRPQPGNPKPRLFRLSEDRAAINRFGFNNEGADAIAARLAARPSSGIIGLNLGANKDSADRAEDYATVLKKCAAHLDFATLNISSPNTERLRELQGREALEALLSTVMSANSCLARPLPIFLKIAPDLGPAELEDIAAAATQARISAIIATNTTLDRAGLQSPHATEKGGLSGAPLFEKSTAVLAQLARLTDIPLVGVGGISTAEDAYRKIKAGAHALQLYTALAYHGLGLVNEILRGMCELAQHDGFSTIAEARGIERDLWA